MSPQERRQQISLVLSVGLSRLNGDQTLLEKQHSQGAHKIVDPSPNQLDVVAH